MNVGGLFLALSLLCILLVKLLLLPQYVDIAWLARGMLLICTVGVLGYILYLRRNMNQPKRLYHKERVKIKFLSVLFVMLGMLLYSWLMLYFNISPYAHFFYDFLIGFPFIAVCMFFYVGYVDRVQDIAEDDYYNFALGFYKRDLNHMVCKRFMLQTAVKIIFVPMMYGSSLIALSNLLDFHWSTFNPVILVSWLFLFGLSIDLLVATAGYIFSSYIFGNRVISTDSSWLGWLVCLICYPPLLILYKLISEQADSFIWTDWLLPNTLLYWVWAALITATWLVYWISTLHFGLRFSNLSWRGLVDTGPYKYLRHPAYLSKNIYWWLHTIPFFGVYGLDMLRNVLALCFVSGIYYLRAKTEEAHLQRFKEYHDYSERLKNRYV